MSRVRSSRSLVQRDMNLKEPVLGSSEEDDRETVFPTTPKLGRDPGFLTGATPLDFEAPSREEAYGWIEASLCRLRYLALGKAYSLGAHCGPVVIITAIVRFVLPTVKNVTQSTVSAYTAVTSLISGNGFKAALRIRQIDGVTPRIGPTAARHDVFIADARATILSRFQSALFNATK